MDLGNLDLSSLSAEQRAQVEEKLKNMSPKEIAQLQAAQAQQSIFRQIIDGKIPSKKIYEDDKCLGILDIKPASKGHSLLLSKEHYAIMPQVPDEDLGHFLKVSKKLSLAMLKGVRASGSTFLVANGPAAGQRVQDFMMHIIPRRDGDSVLEYSKKLVDLEKRRALRGLIAAKISAMTGKDDPQPDEENDGAVQGVESADELFEEDLNEKSEEDDQDDEELDNDVEEDESSDSSKKDVDLDDIANLFA